MARMPRVDCVRHGLVAGGEDMVSTVLRLLRAKKDPLSKSWGTQAGLRTYKNRLKVALENEQDKDMVFWVRRRLLGERAVDLAAEFGYRDGSGVTHAVNRIQQKALNHNSLCKVMEKYRKLSRFMD